MAPKTRIYDTEIVEALGDKAIFNATLDRTIAYLKPEITLIHEGNE